MDIKERFYTNLNMIREQAEYLDEAKQVTIRAKYNNSGGGDEKFSVRDSGKEKFPTKGTHKLSGKLVDADPKDPWTSYVEFSNKHGKRGNTEAGKEGLRAAIHPKHHVKYDIDSTKNFNDAAKKYHEAKMAGHLNK